MSPLELLPPELKHYIAFQVGVLGAVDVANWLQTSRVFRETFDIDDYGHMYHKSLAGLEYCAKRGWWRSFLVCLTNGRQKATLNDALAWTYKYAPSEAHGEYWCWFKAFKFLFRKVVDESNLFTWYQNGWYEIGISCCLSDEALVELVEHTATKASSHEIKAETLRCDRLSLMKKLLEKDLVDPITSDDWPSRVGPGYKCFELMVQSSQFASVVLTFIKNTPCNAADAKTLVCHACPEVVCLGFYWLETAVVFGNQEVVNILMGCDAIQRGLSAWVASDGLQLTTWTMMSRSIYPTIDS